MSILEDGSGTGRAPWAFLVPGVGLMLAVVHLLHLLFHDESLVSTVLGAVLPLLVALGVAAGGIWVRRRRFPDRSNRRIAVWTIGGGLVGGTLASFIVIHQLVEGTFIDEAFFLVASIATAGSAAGVLVGVNDVLRRRRTEQIAALQRSTGDLMNAASREAVAHHAVAIAADVLDLRINGVWLVDGDGSALRPAAISPTGAAQFDEIPVYREGNSLSWEVYEHGDVRWYTDLNDHPGTFDPDTRVKSEIVLPLGSYGVMNVGSMTPNRFDETDVTLARLLADATMVALERADREEQLERRASELERQNERLDRFAGVVSHDLRNPLSVARGYTDLTTAAIDEGDLDAARDHLGRVSDAQRRMENLVERLLELARDGGPVDEPDPVSLSDVVREAWTGVDTDDAVLSVSSEVEETTILADRDRLRQLFGNLVHNSVEHGTTEDRSADDGCGTNDAPAITITVERLSDGFAVSDDGPGIPEEAREHVFESGVTTGEDGVGLGLAIVEEIASDHGWSVAVADGDSGARFEFGGVEFVAGEKA